MIFIDQFSLLNHQFTNFFFQITIRDLSNRENKKIEYNAPVEDIFYAGTGFLLLKDKESLQLFDVQQKRVLAVAKVPRVS